ncbi:MAG TPA: H-NS histone family protein [Paraburkholderia sp.]|jgi:DNA-binding protein H-NS
MDERKRDSIVTYLRRRMQEFGIRPDDLASAIAGAPSMQTGTCYRSAAGDTWNGEGATPQWLTQAISAGQSLKHFEVASNAAPSRKDREKMDGREDPFAGSRLAQMPRRQL